MYCFLHQVITSGFLSSQWTGSFGARPVFYCLYSLNAYVQCFHLDWVLRGSAGVVIVLLPTSSNYFRVPVFAVDWVLWGSASVLLFVSTPCLCSMFSSGLGMFISNPPDCRYAEAPQILGGSSKGSSGGSPGDPAENRQRIPPGDPRGYPQGILPGDLPRESLQEVPQWISQEYPPGGRLDSGLPSDCERHRLA